MKKTTLSILSGLCVAGHIFAASVTFDTAAQYTSNFQLNDGNNGTYVWNSGAGVGGASGFMDIGSGEFNALSAGLTKTAGTIYETSYLIKIGTPATDINDYRAGFVRSTGSNFNGGGDATNAYLRSDGGVSTYTIELFNRTTSVSETSQFSLAADTWYQFQFQMTLNSDTNVDISSALYNLGADGTSTATLVTGSSIAASSITLGNSGFNGTDVFSGFTTRNNTGSVGQGMDNFSFAVVPEPSSFALIGGCLALVSVMVRRRR